MSLCWTFSNEILSINPNLIEAIKSKILVRQERYEGSRFESHHGVSPELGGIKSSSCPYQSLKSEDQVLTDYQKYSNEFDSEREYFHSLKEHTRTTANLNQYNLENLIWGKYNTYLWSPVKDLSQIVNHAADTTVVPIGEYGYECALKMLYTTTILAKLCDNFIHTAATIAESKNWEIISCETATGRHKKYAQDKLKSRASINYIVSPKEYNFLLEKAQTISILETFKEGIQSLQSAISSLMAKKIENYFYYDHLLEEIFNAELPIEFSRIVPFGYTLPVVRSGRFFPEILEVCRSKYLYPDVRISSKFKKIARLIKEEYLVKKVNINSQHNPGYLGNGCPLSYHKGGFLDTGIGYIMKAYRYIFKLVKIDLN